jgi:alkylation response protein AidB-like acyl-CoA dehydrogenase
VSALTDAQRAIRDEARSLARDELLPLADELDPQRAEIPRDVLDRLGRLGYFGLTIPTAYGGRGLGVFEYCLVAEEFARAWMSVASVVARGNGLLDQALVTEEQRERYLPAMARGQLIGAFALSEADAGSDAANIQCAARRDGSDWVIRGEKKWVGFARRADFILLFARTATDPSRPHRGISMFLVDKERDRLPAGIAGEPIDKIGYFGITTWRLRFDDLRLPADALMNEEGKAFAAAMTGLNRKRVYTAARAIGLARGGLEDAIAYARARRQFGRPIADFQAIRFKLADMATHVAAARGLMWDAARQIDAGERNDREAAQAKLFATEMAERVTSEALQIHGGAGYTTEHAVERHWRDARLTTIFEGTSGIQRHIIAERLLDP